MSTRILVTGATGFLGGALTRALHAAGHQVIAQGRDRDKLAALQQLGITPLALDLTNPTAKAPLACDAVVHCAALSSPWGRDRDFVRANVDGTRHALQLARNGGAKRFVHISTPSLYFRFADQIGMREDAPLPPPVNAYARTKREAETLVGAATDLDPITLRPRGLYGAGDTALLPRLLAAAQTRPLPLIRDGAATTDLTYIDDVVDAARAALDAPPRPEASVFNISGGVALNVRDVAERAGERAGVRVRWRRAPLPLVLGYARAGEAVCAALPHRPEPAITAYGAGLFAFTQTLDISAAKRVLGWTPRVSFAEGLERTFASGRT